MGFVPFVSMVNLYPTADPLSSIFSTNVPFHLSVISLNCSCSFSLRFFVYIHFNISFFHRFSSNFTHCVYNSTSHSYLTRVLKSALSPRSRRPRSPIINFVLRFSTSTHLSISFSSFQFLLE